MLGGEFVEVDKAEADKADHFHMEEVGPLAHPPRESSLLTTY